MPIAVKCTGCKQRLRVPHKAAGKRIKCPKCQTVLRVPMLQAPNAGDAASATVVKRATQPEQSPQPEAPPEPNGKQPAAPTAEAEPVRPKGTELQDEPARTAPSPQPSVPERESDAKESLPDRWYLKTEDGEDYGPVPKAELDQWRDEGRITADCHVLQDGAEQWQWASDIYPELETQEEAPAVAGPPPLKSRPAETPAPVQANTDAVDPSAFQFAAADASPTLRARGRKRVKKVAKRTARATPAAVSPARSVASGEVSPKSKLVAGLLGIFLGGYGVHRFYLGYTGLGLAMLFTCGGCGIWALIDAIMIFMGSVPDAQGRPLRD
jgi:hypothetical protein